MQERRAHQRFSCELRARVELPDGRALDGRTADISFSGVCLHADEMVAVKTRVRFHLWAVLPSRETSEIVVPGRVVWSTYVEGAYQIGASFDRDMDNYAWTRLDGLLQLLENEDR